MMDRPAIIAHPALIFVVFLVPGYIMDLFFQTPLPGIPDNCKIYTALLFAVAAIAVVTWSFVVFRKNRTSADPYSPATTIVKTGPFRISRNPFYLGVFAAYMAMILIIDSVFMIPLLVLMMAVLHFGVVLREEEYLEKKFGEEYLKYKREVRRWI